MSNFIVLLHHEDIMDYIEGTDYTFKHALGVWVRGLIMGRSEMAIFKDVETLFSGPEEEFEDFCDDVTTIMANIDEGSLRRVKSLYCAKEEEIGASALACYVEVNAIDQHTLGFTVTGIK